MEKGYIKANSLNLPKVDVDMVRYFFLENSDFSSVEIKGKKLIRSTRESYGDNAVGFVQVKRENQLCIIKGRLTPEHKVREKGYLVEVQIDEKEDIVQICKCHDCAAAEGGCKHAVAFLLWLHRRSEEPSVTSVTCYWKKPKMSTSTEIIRARDIGNTSTIQSFENINLVTNFLETVSRSKCQANVIKYFKDRRQPLSMHRMCSQISLDTTSQNFLEQVSKEMTKERIQAVFNSTKGQSENPVWFELRYGRITGSILHEAAHCRTKEGSLVNKIMGEQSTFTTEAMLRGKKLEKYVIEVIKRKENISISDSGLILSEEYPMLGASPDGINNEYIIEIKCPRTEKTFKTYVQNGELNKKCWVQIQSQMFFAKKKMGLFCVAHPNFESSKNVDIYKVHYDDKILNIFEKATVFWSEVVFPKLQTIYS